MVKGNALSQLGESETTADSTLKSAEAFVQEFGAWVAKDFRHALQVAELRREHSVELLGLVAPWVQRTRQNMPAILRSRSFTLAGQLHQLLHKTLDGLERHSIRSEQEFSAILLELYPIEDLLVGLCLVYPGCMPTVIAEPAGIAAPPAARDRAGTAHTTAPDQRGDQ